LAAVGHYAASTITLSRNNGNNSEDLFSATGNLSTLTEGLSFDLAGTDIGSVIQNSAGILSITFNANATPARVNDTLRSIAYRNSSDTPPARVDLDWTFSDGNTGAQGVGGALAATGTTTVNITRLNDAPIGAPSATLANAEEDQSSIVSAAELLQGVSDADGDALSVSRLTSPQASISANGDGTYTVVPVPNHNGVVQLNYLVTDGYGGNTAALQTYQISAINDAPTFATGDGKILQPVGSGTDYAPGMVLQPDGRILLAGFSSDGTNSDFSLIRFNPDGSLDSSFGAGGKIILPIANDDQANSVALQPDGKIVVVGQGRASAGAEADYRAVRLNPNGSLDSSFGQGGTALLDVEPGDDTSYGVTALADGRLVLSGVSASRGNDFSMVRLLADGTLDTSFSADGKSTYDLSLSTDSGRGTIALPDGSLLMVGHALQAGIWQFSVIHVDANGLMTPTFGAADANGQVADGKVIVPVGPAYGFATTMALQPSTDPQQPDYKVLLAGHADTGAGYDFGIIRLNANGVLDETFGGTGKVVFPVGLGDEQVYAMAVQANGYVLIAGRGLAGSDPSNGDYAVMRLTAEGALDTSFGDAGTALIAIGTGDDIGQSIAVQADGKIVIGGSSFNGSDYDFSAVRLNPDGSLDETFDNQRFGHARWIGRIHRGRRARLCSIRMSRSTTLN
jgi:uncharacterized delta-60 repeat protein